MTGPPTSEGGPIGPRRILQLAFKAWPFVRPLLRHLLILMASGGLITLILFAVTLLATDLFNNKILVGDKLQPMQAALLFVNDSYVADNITDNINQSELLNPDQRKVVRNHGMVWTVVNAALVIPLGALLLYYNLWIWQMINQNLRVAMIAKAEHLSLRFHSQSRVGDAIFRVYQDSATITSFLQEAFINPVVAVYGVITSLAFIAFFDPLLAIVCALVVLHITG